MFHRLYRNEMNGKIAYLLTAKFKSNSKYMDINQIHFIEWVFYIYSSTSQGYFNKCQVIIKHNIDILKINNM